MRGGYVSSLTPNWQGRGKGVSYSGPWCVCFMMTKVSFWRGCLLPAGIGMRKQRKHTRNLVLAWLLKLNSGCDSKLGNYSMRSTGLPRWGHLPGLPRDLGTKSKLLPPASPYSPTHPTSSPNTWGTFLHAGTWPGTVIPPALCLTHVFLFLCVSA